MIVSANSNTAASSPTADPLWNRQNMLNPRLRQQMKDNSAAEEDLKKHVKRILAETASLETKETRSLDDEISNDPQDNLIRQMDYQDYQWNELPDNVKAAARVLGYNRFLWDHSSPCLAESKEWQGLTPEEQSAAHVLGYTQETWDD